MHAYQELIDYIDTINIVDVHEHLIKDELRIQRYQDYISLVFSNYTYINAIASGISWEEVKLLQSARDFSEKIPVYRKACCNIRNTTSFRCLDRAFCDLYGMSLLDDDYTELNRRYKLYNKTDFTYNVLEKMKIAYAINDVFDASMQNTDYDMDQRIFLNSARCDKYIMVHECLEELEEEFHQKIQSLEQLCELLKKFIRDQKETYHAVALKIGVAYSRSLYFAYVDRADAQNVFRQVLQARNDGRRLPFAEVKPLSDYMLQCILEEAEHYDLPVQIHTGLQDRNVNYLEHANPLRLNSLFERHPGVVFNLFHTGFPFGREAGVLAKMFVNVYVDFSWVHILSSSYAVDLLREYFELIPANKFCGFGGDFCNVEGAYGHLQLAKENIAEAISSMINKGWYSMEYGKELAKQILYDNPKEIYRIDKE